MGSGLGGLGLEPILGLKFGAGFGVFGVRFGSLGSDLSLWGQDLGSHTIVSREVNLSPDGRGRRHGRRHQVGKLRQGKALGGGGTRGDPTPPGGVGGTHLEARPGGEGARVGPPKRHPGVVGAQPPGAGDVEVEGGQVGQAGGGQRGQRGGREGTERGQ